MRLFIVTAVLSFRDQTLFRVWDVFMIDGIDVLFRIAFAILRTNEQELLRCASIPAMYVALESLPNRMWEADRLLQVCGIFFVLVCVLNIFVVLSRRR